MRGSTREKVEPRKRGRVTVLNNECRLVLGIAALTGTVLCHAAQGNHPF